MEITILKKKIDLWKVKEFVVFVLGVICLAMTNIFLINGQNEIYQTLKDIQYAKAFFMLAAFMFVVQRVRLINWQSLVVSCIYWPFGYMYRESRAVYGPDIFNRDKVVVFVVWLFLLIVVDMIVYKKYTPLEKFNKGSLGFFALMAFFLVFFRNGRNHPIILLMAFIFYLIPMNLEKWKQVVNWLCYGHFVAFVIMIRRSLVNNPEVDPNMGRWYGDFLNIGDFGLFLGAVIATVLYQLYRTKKEKGRKNVEYIFWMVALAVTVWAVLRVSTITCLIGILFICLMGFVVVRKNAAVLNSLFRFVLVTVGLVIIGIVGFLALKGLSNMDLEYWNRQMLEGNVIIKPFANLVARAHYMFDETRTFSNSTAFEPGTIINYLDLFTSGRLSIIKVFSEKYNIVGNPSIGMQVGWYFAYNTHNTYAQTIYDYGYVGGGLYLAFLVYCTVASAVKFIKEKQIFTVFGCVWMAMLLGVMNGESAFMYFPIIVMTFLVIYPIMVKVEKVEE